MQPTRLYARAMDRVFHQIIAPALLVSQMACVNTPFAMVSTVQIQQFVLPKDIATAPIIVYATLDTMPPIVRSTIVSM